MLMEYKELNKQFWGQHFGRGDILRQVAGMYGHSDGGIYIAHQDEKIQPKNDNFGISGIKAALAANTNPPDSAGGGSV